MCPGFKEWWLYKSVLNLQNLWSLLSIFIGVDILVLINEFVVVAILSEWWSVPTNVGTPLHITLDNNTMQYIE